MDFGVFAYKISRLYTGYKKGGECMNQVGLVGRITKDPELRTFEQKRPYTTFTIAVNRSFRNSQGNVEADFVLCSAWGKLAETIVKHCGKGSLIGVNGRLNSRTYTNQQSERIYTLDVTAEDIRFYKLNEPIRTESMEIPGFVQGEKPTNQGERSEHISDSGSKSSSASVVAEAVEPLVSPLKEQGKRTLPIPS